jgi:hypothetical protein
MPRFGRGAWCAQIDNPVALFAVPRSQVERRVSQGSIGGEALANIREAISLRLEVRAELGVTVWPITHG